MSDLILGIDTSTTVSVGLARDGEILRSYSTTDTRSHVETLVGVIQQVMGEIPLRELTGVAVGMGPGPFTGLRVGIVAATTLASTLGIGVIHVCSLDILARQYGGFASGGDFLTCTDARRKEVYWARYDAQGTRVDGPHVSKPEDLPDAECFGPGTPFFCASPAPSFCASPTPSFCASPAPSFCASVAESRLHSSTNVGSGPCDFAQGDGGEGAQGDGLRSAHGDGGESGDAMTLDAGFLAACARSFVDVGPTPLYLRHADAVPSTRVKSVLPGVSP
ncbi:MAG: tRNA (adenosine(37)-N6)-threonylcarbamoyltransferase complex dimerization subunit type 1 TsaB [Propionibacteriaceae bacterium]|nr:tRNA (adenosine(37)-N6)-threonylcarbamoyltransferase complex dimerization subunit type 1 TsaB [Propionibacteriaceae bacterium]